MGAKVTRNPDMCSTIDPEITNPIYTLVTTDPSQLSDLAALPGNEGQIFADATAGKTYSVMLTVYDALGASSRTRLDGFLVQATGCGPLLTQPVTGGGVSFGLSGAAVCTNKSLTVFSSQAPIDINGLSLAPENGDYIDVADVAGGGTPDIWTSTTPASGPPSGQGACLPVDLLIDGAADGKLAEVLQERRR